jgi:hypothetical protein
MKGIRCKIFIYEYTDILNNITDCKFTENLHVSNCCSSVWRHRSVNEMHFDHKGHVIVRGFNVSYVGLCLDFLVHSFSSLMQHKLLHVSALQGHLEAIFH